MPQKWSDPETNLRVHGRYVIARKIISGKTSITTVFSISVELGVFHLPYLEIDMNVIHDRSTDHNI